MPKADGRTGGEKEQGTKAGNVGIIYPEKKKKKKIKKEEKKRYDSLFTGHGVSARS